MSDFESDKINLEEAIKAYQNANDFNRSNLRGQLLNGIDTVARSKEGLEYLYEKIVEIEAIHVFEATAWQDPSTLVPSLVKGTIQHGHPNSSLEILSELRMLAIANGRSRSKNITAQAATDFIVKVMVLNLEFALRELSEETRLLMSHAEQQKAINLFQFLLHKIGPDLIKDILAQEITVICQQRPVVTSRVKDLVSLLNRDLTVYSNSNADRILKRHINAVHHPSHLTREVSDIREYNLRLSELNESDLNSEALELGGSMRRTGLVSQFHAELLLFLTRKNSSLVPVCLGLNQSGRAEWNRHNDLITGLINEVVHPHNSQCIYGLACMMNRSPFSNNVVRMGLENIRKIKIHGNVKKRIIKSVGNASEHVSPRQYLLGATFRVLGQPLGVGQGNNPTCQSARGISMWAMYNPGRLIDLITMAASHDQLIFRFENNDLDSTQLALGLAEKIDYRLDAVSVLLVPHLDKVYNEMMKRASGRFEDPHKWVNPAMYGNWVQLGFASAYDYYTNSILDYEGFLKTFYKHFHLEYNGHHRMVYPNPVGIFLTSATGQKVGFHAIALLRVQKDRKGTMRAYFLNPNNEGRQDWGQGIKPSVHGNGEQHGESSLPFDEFAARIYAFHFDSHGKVASHKPLPIEKIEKVKGLAKESWGRDYQWFDRPKKWE